MGRWDMYNMESIDPMTKSHQNLPRESQLRSDTNKILAQQKEILAKLRNLAYGQQAPKKT